MIFSPFVPVFKMAEITRISGSGADVLAGNFVAFLRQSFSNSLIGRVLFHLVVLWPTCFLTFRARCLRAFAGRALFHSSKQRQQRKALGSLFAFARVRSLFLGVPSKHEMIAVAHEACLYNQLLSGK